MRLFRWPHRPLLTIIVQPPQLILITGTLRNFFLCIEGYKSSGQTWILDDLRIHNRTALANQILKFVQTYRLSKPVTIIAIEGPGLLETVTDQLPQESPALIWDFLSLKHNDTAPFYACGLAREIIVQYQLLMQACDSWLLGITSVTMAQLCVAAVFAPIAPNARSLQTLKESLGHFHSPEAIAFGATMIRKKLT